MSTSCTEGYLRNEERISATDAIEFDIFSDFYRNLEHKDEYIQSIVKYQGKKVYIRFYSWIGNPLRKLADHIYKKMNNSEI